METKTPEQILKEDYSPKFDELRKNRVIMSGYKYGPVKKNYETGLTDAIENLELCLEKFKQTKNTEYLVDVANYAMFRYMFPKQGEFFKATDSSESAGHVGYMYNEMLAEIKD